MKKCTILFLLSALLFAGCKDPASQALYSVTVVSGQNGTATADIKKAAEGAVVTLTAMPAEGYEFTLWTAEIGSVTFDDPKTTPTTFIMPASNVAIRADFTAKTVSAEKYSVTVVASGSGTAEADVTEAEEGAEVTLTATPAAGYIFNKWTVVSGDVEFDDAMANPLVFEMPGEDVEIGASFVEEMDGDGFALIADANFKTYCEEFDTDGDGFLSQREALAVTRIDVNCRMGRFDYNTIHTMAGIEQFINLEYLDIARNHVAITKDEKSLDLSANTALEYLDCSYHQHADRPYSLDLSANVALKTLICVQCYLVDIDLRNCAELVKIDCRINRLTSLDLSDLVSLEVLLCDSNLNLAEFDVSNCPALRRLSCNYTAITSLDVSKNANLTLLSCSDIGVKNEMGATSDYTLRSLDVSGNPKLDTLMCSYNRNLAELDVTENSELLCLILRSSEVSELDLSGNAKLKHLVISENKISTLDVRGNTALEFLGCQKSGLAELDVTQNTELRELYADTGNTYSELDISNNPKLLVLMCSNSGLTSGSIRQIIADLPAIPTGSTTGAFWAINCPGSPQITDADRKVAEDKGWAVLTKGIE